MFEFALLQAEVGEAKVDVAGAVPRLAAIESTPIAAVTAMTDVLEQLETMLATGSCCEVGMRSCSAKVGLRSVVKSVTPISRAHPSAFRYNVHYLT